VTIISLINVARYPKVNLINIDFNYLGLKKKKLKKIEIFLLRY